MTYICRAGFFYKVQFFMSLAILRVVFYRVAKNSGVFRVVFLIVGF